MPKMTIRQHFEAPLEWVFDTLSDFENAARHVRGIDRMELLTPGAIGVGTRFRETRTMFGKQSSVEMEITAFDRLHGYTVEGTTCGSRYRAAYHLLSDIAGTHVRLEIETQPIHFLAKLVAPLACLMQGSMKKCLLNDLEDIQAVLATKVRS